jgi:phytanoyl-CoA hydroxylase
VFADRGELNRDTRHPFQSEDRAALESQQGSAVKDVRSLPCFFEPVARACMQMKKNTVPDMATLQQQWQQEGFVVLPKFYSDADIDAAHEAVDRVWRDGASRVVVDDLTIDHREMIRDVEGTARSTHRFKVNDLFLEYEEIRRLALNTRLSPILKGLLADTPVLCNSLNFAHGSTQGDHVDSLYMTPRSRGHLVAIWVALEDCHMDAGPLRYYPGSHKIDQYVFSTGSNHAVSKEMSQWSAYMQDQVAERGLAPRTFAAKRGDVFVWSAYLLHGGEPINSPERTRKSIVFHYFSEEDSRALGLRLIPEAGGYWWHRPHQAVPGKEPPQAPPLSRRSALSSEFRHRLHRLVGAGRRR